LICSKEAFSVESVVLRGLPLEDLKREIRTLMADGTVRYEDEIADALRVDVLQVLRALDQLEEAGEIEVP
jgi:predicted ArsR family transcriptional regulator